MNKEISLEDLDLYTLIRDVVMNIWAIILSVMIATMGASMYLRLSYKPVYKSQVTFMVSTKESNSSIYTNLSTAIEMANIFTEIMDSDILREKAAQIGGYDSFPGEIDAHVIPETNLLVVSVKAKSPYDSFIALKIITENYKLVSDYIYGNAVLEVIEDIKMPYGPSNIVNKERVVKLAQAAGGLLMTAGICCLSFLRDTVKNRHHVEKKLDTKLLTTINHEKKNKTLKQIIMRTKKSPLLSNPVVSFKYASSYQKACMKIENVFDINKYKILAVVSVSQNEGKTTVCSNIAISLAKSGKKVLLIDGDLKKPAVRKVFEKKATNTFEDYLNGAEAEYDDTHKIYFMLNDKAYDNSAELLGSNKFKEMLQKYSETMDYILIDTPPFTSVSDGEIIAGQADATLLVVRQDLSCTRDINDVIDILSESGSELLGCILNNVRSLPYRESADEGYYKTYYGKSKHVQKHLEEITVKDILESEVEKGS